MIKLLSLAAALMMSMSLAVPAFATGEPPVAPTPEEGWIMPRVDIYTKTINTSESSWSSVYFMATPNSGNYIRYWVSNTTNEAIRVYFYKVVKSGFNYVEIPISSVVPGADYPMTVSANNSEYQTFYLPTADSEMYCIKIEAYVSGGTINSSINVAQYINNPG